MLRDLLKELCHELEIKMPKANEKGFFFAVNKEVEVAVRDLEPGVAMQANICPCPKKRREEFFIYVMRANLLGQGTGGSRIGIDADEKFLTLSIGLPYELNYKMFRETFEDFVNYLIYWRDIVTKFEREQNVYRE